MSYVAKTDWKHDDPVTEQDLNRWETGIKENTEKLGTVQEFALTTASGDAKESITNVNTATTVGLFLVGSTATGAPTTAVGLLYVWRRGSTHLLQEYWETGLNKRYHRTSTDNGATWTAWQTIANTDVATTSANGLMSSADKATLDYLRSETQATLTLQNGASAGVRTPGVDRQGDMVKLSGTVSGTVVGTVFATLPEGFRPPRTQVFAVAGFGTGSVGKYTVINVTTTGQMSPLFIESATTNIDLSSIVFLI